MRSLWEITSQFGVGSQSHLVEHENADATSNEIAVNFRNK